MFCAISFIFFISYAFASGVVETKYNGSKGKFLRKIILTLIFPIACIIYFLIIIIILPKNIAFENITLFFMLYGFSAMVLFGVITIQVINNFLNQNEFFYKIEWKEFAILLFCVSLGITLLSEEEQLFKKNTPISLLSLILIILVGYSMWPKTKSNRIWTCTKCENCNPEKEENCLNPDCPSNSPPISKKDIIDYPEMLDNIED